MSELEKAMRDISLLVTQEIDRLLPLEDVPEARVVEAMRYSSLNGGKRLRPFLVMTSASLFHVAHASALRTAAAVEMVHCYSLVHDDLPAMDNDDLRRGVPTCHKKFDEATAILAGDALLTKSFEVLGGEATHSDPKVRADLVVEFAQAIGEKGMVGGQMFDMQAHNYALDVAGITRLQRLKTGRLIAFSCEAGAILGKAHPEQRQALLNYAHDLGLVFQITDDILDVEGEVEQMGKALRKDEGAGKATFVSLLGLDRAKSQAQALTEQAIGHLKVFGNHKGADLLKETALFVLNRRN